MELKKVIYLLTFSLAAQWLTAYPSANHKLNDSDILWNVQDTIIPQIVTKHEFCLVDSLALAVDTSYALIEWSTEQKDSMIYVYTPGVYKVTVYDEEGNSGEAFQEVKDFIVEGPAIIGNPLMCDENTQILRVNEELYTRYQWFRPEESAPDEKDSTAQIEIAKKGTYTIRVLDSLGCSAYDSLNIGYYDSLGLSVLGDTVFCPGSTNTINIDTLNLISFIWSTGDSINSNQTIEEEGIYSVHGINKDGCQVDGEIKVSLYDTSPVLLESDSLFCEGSTITIKADTSNVSDLKWSNGSSADSIIVDEAGIYEVSGLDSNLCQVNGITEVAFFETNEIEILGGTQFCQGESIELFINDTDLKDIVWSDESTGSSIIINQIGEVSVSAIDTNGCRVYGSTSLEYYSTESINILGNQTLCPNEVGVLYVDPSLYDNIEWNSGVKSDSLYIVSTGEYSITATDINGCSVEGNIIILEAEPFSPEIEGDISICSNQVSTLMVPSGYASVEWSNGKSTRVIQVTEPGTYSVTVTDEDGCIGINAIDVEVAQFIPPVILGDEFICVGGQTSLSIAGQGYTDVIWDNFEQGEQITVSEAGSYTVNATDAQGCQGTSTFIVFEYPQVEVEIEGDTRICADASGVLEINNNSVSTFNWDNGSNENAITINECNRNYSLEYVDLNGCGYYAELFVQCHDSIEINLLNTIDISCNGGADGLLAVEAEVNNENGQFMYEWSTGSSNQLINNLSAGNYSITVTDQFGCTNIAAYQTTEPSPLQLEINTLINRTCFYSLDNFIDIEGEGGAGNYRYTWLDDDIQSALETQFLPGDSVHAIPDGYYQIQLMDQNECVDTFEINFQGPDTIKVNNVELTEVTCYGDSSGTISLEAIGGTGTLSYDWDHEATGNNIGQLAAGTYTVAIIDEKSCSIERAFDINQHPEITVQDQINNESIPGAMDGSITINVFGGVGTNYEIKWSNGNSTSTINGLSPGEYTVTIQDEVECSKVLSYIVGAGDCMLDVSFNTQKISCYGLSDGGLDVLLTDLVLPYRVFVNGSSYADPAGTTAFNNPNFSIGQLAPGDYSIEFLDAANCNQTIEFNLEEPAALALDLFVGDFASCADSEDGNIISNIGTQEINGYLWSNGSMESNLTNVAPGFYELTITDINECTTSRSIDLTFEDVALPILSLQDVEVYLDIEGQFTWPAANAFDNGSSDNCSAVSFNYEIPSAYDCTMMDTIILTIAGRDINSNVAIGEANIIVKDSLFPEIMLDTIRLSTCDSVELSLAASDFRDNCQVKSFGWDDSEAAKGPFPEGLSTLLLKAEDRYGNVSTKEIVILNEVVLDVEYTLFEPSCFGFNDGEIVFETDGTNEPFKVNYDDNIDIEALTEGIYTFTVNDKTGCERIIEIIIEEPPLLEFTVIDFNDQPDIGFIEIHLFGGTAPYGFQWLKDGLLYSNDKDIYNLPAGLYELSMLDSKGCTIITDPFYVGISSNENIANDHVVNVFPNPTDGQVNISISDIEPNKTMEISVYNLQGTLVYSERTYTKENYSIDLSHLASEMYLLRLKTDDMDYIHKLVKSQL